MAGQKHRSPVLAKQDAIAAEQRGKLDTARARMGAPFASLAIPSFRYLWFGQVGAASAMHADMLARSWLVWELTGSYTAVAGVNLARGIPMLVFGLLGGVAADRFDRKRVLMVIQMWTFAMHASMAALIITGVMELWHVYALASLLGISTAMNQPVRTSIIPQMVDKRRLLNAITLNSIAINGTRLGGPAIIAFVIGFYGFGSAYVFSASVYILVVWTTTRVEIPKLPESSRKSGNVGQQLMEGFRFIGKDRLILTLVFLGLAPFAIGIAHRSLLPGLITEVLHADIELFGILQSVAAAGSLAAGLYLASRTSIPRKGALMLGVTVIYGLALFAISGASALWMVMLLLILGAMSQTVFRAANTILLLERTPEGMRGRVLSVTLVDHAMSPLVGIGAGLIADRWGIGTGFAFLGIAILAVAAIAFIMSPALRKA